MNSNENFILLGYDEIYKENLRSYEKVKKEIKEMKNTGNLNEKYVFKMIERGNNLSSLSSKLYYQKTNCVKIPLEELEKCGYDKNEQQSLGDAILKIAERKDFNEIIKISKIFDENLASFVFQRNALVR